MGLMPVHEDGLEKDRQHQVVYSSREREWTRRCLEQKKKRGLSCPFLIE